MKKHDKMQRFTVTVDVVVFGQRDLTSEEMIEEVTEVFNLRSCTSVISSAEVCTVQEIVEQ